jgi:hypothetical protein
MRYIRDVLDRRPGMKAGELDALFADELTARRPSHRVAAIAG